MNNTAIKKTRFILFSILFSLAASFVIADDSTGFTSFTDDTQSSPTVEWSGTGSLHTRYMKESDDVTVYPELNFNLDYKAASSDFHGSFTLSKDYNFTNAYDVSHYLNKLINEAYYRVYKPDFTFEAGYMKILWGKGDEMHTFDNINPVDYSDFLNNSYMDRKMSEAMFKLDIPFGSEGLVEALYTPVFTPDIFPVTGPWVQKDYTEMENIVIAETGTFSEDILNIEDTNTFSHGQGGIRITDSLSGVDFGATYEYTFLRDPTVDMSRFLLDSTQKINISWDRLHLFGVEAATVLAGFNFRAEGAYYLTADTKGTDPLVHNNKVQYLIGFDRDLPVGNVNLNIQLQGEIKLNTDKIDANNLADIEYSPDGTYNSDIIGWELRNTVMNDKLTMEMQGAYVIGEENIMINPSVEYTLVDDAVIKIGYTFYRGDSDTLFGQFKNNDMFEITCRYSF